MNRLALCVVATLAVVAPSQAIARTKILFSTYEGPDSVVTGKGGAKMTAQGIDWWTGGDPAKRYRILGILTDSRTNEPLNGDALGSKRIAQKVKEVGGTAVVVWRRSETPIGIETDAQFGRSYNNYQGTASSSIVSQRATTFIVIQVLDQ